MRARILFPMCRRSIAAVLLLQGAPLPAQVDPAEKKFFEVKVDQGEIYSYENLKFTGDFTSFESPSGQLALGRTTQGVTILIILGEGTLTIEAPEAAQEKFKTVFGVYPLKTIFKTLYMRLNPKEFEDLFENQKMTSDAAALAKAQELYDEKFLGSYHAGPLAIFPPVKTRFMDFDTAEFGQVVNEEGYWLILRRFAPYASVYASRFVNPKQR